MAKKDINLELSKLTPSTLVELFTLDTTPVDGNRLPVSQQLLHFHNFVEDGSYNSVFFGNPLIEYKPIPIKYEDFEIKGDGTTLPRPRVTIGNPNGIVSYYIRQAQKLNAATFSRVRTFAKFLHEDTWGLPTNPLGVHDPDAKLADDKFQVERIVQENKDNVVIELSTALETFGINIPRRRMYALSCPFEYRNSTGCNFGNAAPVADSANRKFTDFYGLTLSDAGKWNDTTTYNPGDYVYIEAASLKENGQEKKRFYYVNIVSASGVNDKPSAISNKWVLDGCSQKINGCLLRFGDTMDSNGIPFGGYPALSRVEAEALG